MIFSETKSNDRWRDNKHGRFKQEWMENETKTVSSIDPKLDERENILWPLTKIETKENCTRTQLPIGVCKFDSVCFRFDAKRKKKETKCSFHRFHVVFSISLFFISFKWAAVIIRMALCLCVSGAQTRQVYLCMNRCIFLLSLSSEPVWFSQVIWNVQSKATRHIVRRHPFKFNRTKRTEKRRKKHRFQTAYFLYHQSIKMWPMKHDANLILFWIFSCSSAAERKQNETRSHLLRDRIFYTMSVDVMARQRERVKQKKRHRHVSSSMWRATSFKSSIDSLQFENDAEFLSCRFSLCFNWFAVCWRQRKTIKITTKIAQSTDQRMRSW